jgi:hypothetical protein
MDGALPGIGSGTAAEGREVRTYAVTAPKLSGNGSEDGTAAVPYTPILLRGIIAAAFALVTVFWQQPTDLGTGLATGIYLLASAGTMLQLSVVPSVQRLGLRSALALEAGVGAVAGVLALFLRGPLAYGVVLGICFIVLGAAGLAVGWRARRKSVLGRDWLWTGAIFLVTGVLLPFFIPMGTKALFGVVGGSAIIIAVLLLLAGLTFRHDASASRGGNGAAHGASRTDGADGTEAAGTVLNGNDAGLPKPGTR